MCIRDREKERQLELEREERARQFELDKQERGLQRREEDGRVKGMEMRSPLDEL